MLKEREYVSVTIWFTYVRGYELSDSGDMVPFTDVIRARAGLAAAQSYLRRTRGARLIVTEAETERTVWRCPIDAFMSVSQNVEGKTLDTFH